MSYESLVPAPERPAPLSRALAVLPIFVGMCLTALLLGGWATADSVSTWYPQLAKPWWTPPSYLFGIVWPILYVMIAIAGWLAWQQRPRVLSAAMIVYAVQLVLNTAWSFIFFGARQIEAGLVEIAILAVIILLNVILFWRIRPLAGALLLPYLAWVCFATMLNAAFAFLNRAGQSRIVHDVFIDFGFGPIHLL